MRAATRPTDETYYEYILCYFDDVIYIIHNARHTMLGIQKDMKFKNDNIEDTYLYLGASLMNKELNGQTIWKMTRQEYIKNAIENLEK